MTAMARSTQLTQLERYLLVIPLLGGAVFGALPFLLGTSFGSVLGYPGNDPFTYRLAGAATFGYAVALFMGIRAGNWIPLRFVVVATLVFNLASLVACIMYATSGGTNLVSYLILATSIVIVAICLWILNNHRDTPSPASDIKPLVRLFLIIGAAASAVFGLLALFAPTQTSNVVGLLGTDVFLIRQAGAATLGYVAMAVLGLMSGASAEFPLTTVMAFVFNALSFIASIISLISGGPLPITLLIGAASGLFTVVSGYQLMNPETIRK